MAAYLHQNFADCVEAAAGQRSLSAPTAAVLRRLVSLHGVVVLVEAAGDLLEHGYCTGGFGGAVGGRGMLVVC